MLDDHNKAVELINDSQGLIQNKQYNEAIPKLEAAVKLDSTIRDTYLLLYKAGYYAGNTETPKLYLKKAKSVFLEDDEIAYYLGKIYQTEKDYDNALIEFNCAIKYGKKNGEDYPIVYDYFASRGAVYLSQDKYEEALKDLNYSLTLNDTKGSVYANRGIVLYNLKKYDEACTSWNRAHELGITNVESYITKYCK
jgi:tetratricopeptide (TPR) repeat protein